MTPLELYDKYQREYSDIGLHLPWLREHARGKVLEIGVREGVSTAALLLGVAHNGGHVYSVDVEPCGEIFTDPDTLAMWTFLRADSRTESEQVLRALGKGVIDLLFIDGDHTYAGCISDLTTYGPYANVIVVHDTSSEFLGVWEAVIAYFRAPNQPKFSRAEFFNSSSGMGVLYR